MGDEDLVKPPTRYRCATGRVAKWKDSTNIESELFRLRMSFATVHHRLLARITTGNDELHRFFSRASGATTQSPSTVKSKVQFRELHEQAEKSYACLAQHWQRYSYQESHIVGITARTKVFASSSELSNGCFNVLFEHTMGIKQVKIRIEAANAATSSSKLPTDYAAPLLNLEATSQLQDHRQHKKYYDSLSNAAKSKIVSAVAFPSVLLASSSVSRAPPKSTLSQPTRKLHKSPGRLLRSGDENVVMSSLPKFIPPAVRLAEGSPGCTRQVAGGADVEQIHDLCAFAKSATYQSQKNFLRVDDKKKMVFQLEPVGQNSFDSPKTQSIDKFLTTKSSQYNRLAVGLRFALTLISLATSAWTPEQPARDDVILVCSEGSAKKAAKPLGPFFLRNSRDICSAPASSNGYPWHAKSPLLLLGVILLELFHGEALEKQPSWAESLDEDGEPNEMTTFCGAFLWVSRAQRSMVNFIGEELGGALYEAIRKCICFDFNRDDDYGDSRFAEIVYKEVVVPLEKCCPRI
ncbi:hypothetical protein CPLU01_10352 [Colletotrichum plurivorum]|uniref:DUF7580 domain-containing protein n=1 Tax=Colletotrichum plurivorum TaxID=2175906 RepID=A0A8H6K6K1_9PEZI|nr:hypothetical protein CPLU01_10352 [Colletotrichum plurivorum]